MQHLGLLYCNFERYSTAVSGDDEDIRVQLFKVDCLLAVLVGLLV